MPLIVSGGNPLAYGAIQGATAYNQGASNLDALKAGAISGGMMYAGQELAGAPHGLTGETSGIAGYNPDLGGASNYSGYQIQADAAGDVGNFRPQLNPANSYTFGSTYTQPDAYTQGLGGDANWLSGGAGETNTATNLGGGNLYPHDISGIQPDANGNWFNVNPELDPANLGFTTTNPTDKSKTNYGKLINPLLGLMGGTAPKGSLPQIAGNSSQNTGELLKTQYNTTPKYIEDAIKKGRLQNLYGLIA
jgi:hypothetical protein